MNVSSKAHVEEKYFPSVSALRAEHENLLRKRQESEETQELFFEVRSFVKKGNESGVLIYDINERWAAQSILDYWANLIYKYSQEDLDANLKDYDPNLAPDLDPAKCPYLGLDAFNEERHDLFYGRQSLVEELIAHLQSHRILIIMGESGSGKSSVVLAGIIPKLKNGALENSENLRYFRRIIPGSDPLANLAQLNRPDDLGEENWLNEQIQCFKDNPKHLLELLNQAGEQPAVLVIDQFEEVFTLCSNRVDQQAFVDNLLALVDASGMPYRLILTMRSEFETKIVTLQHLQEYFQKAVVRIPPMNASEIRQAIDKPAEKVGLIFDQGLVDRLVDDVLGEPAALPLLQFTLFKLWQNKQRNRVTWEVYNRLGGGRKALENSAEVFYNSLLKELQDALREILLQLVRIDERLEVYSRRVRRKSLFESVSYAPPRIEYVLKIVVKEKLVRLTKGATPEDDQVEVTHEALIRNWQRFISWIDEKRAMMRQHQQLTEAAERWFDANRDKSYLWQGVLLEKAQKYPNLSEKEKLFIEKSLAYEQASTRRLQRLAIGLMIALAVAIIFGLTTLFFLSNASEAANTNATLAAEKAIFAEEKAHLAETSQANAETAQAASTDANTQRANAEIAKSTAQAAKKTAEAASTQANIQRETAVYNAGLASSRQLSAQALGFLDTEPDISALLSIEAFKTNDSWEARNVLLDNIQHAATQVIIEVGRDIPIQQDDIISVAMSPDGERAAWGDLKGSIVIWNYKEQQIEQRLSVPYDDEFYGLAFSPDGKWLASGGDAAHIFIWDINSYQKTMLDGVVNSVYSVSYSPDGNHLAAAVGTQIRIWDLAEMGAPREFQNQASYIREVAWSPDGNKIASAGFDHRVVIWDSENGEILGSHRLHHDIVYSVSWAPDSSLLASGSKDGSVIIYDFNHSRTVTELNNANKGRTVHTVAFSSDGKILASGGYDATILFVNMETLKPVGRLENYFINGVTSIAFSPRKNLLISGSFDNTLGLHRILTQQPLSSNLASIDGQILNLSANNDDTILLTVSHQDDIEVWVRKFNEVQQIGEIHLNTSSAAVKPDQSQIALGDESGLIHIFDIVSSEEIISFQDLPGPVSSLAYSSDGKILAVGICAQIVEEDNRNFCGQNEIYLLDSLTGVQIGEPIFGHADYITALAFSPDGLTLASGSQDMTIQLWDIPSRQPVSLPFESRRAGITSLAFDPDSRILASGDSDGYLTLWVMETGNQIASPMIGSTDQISSLDFSANGMILFSGSHEGSLLAWDIDPNSWITRNCQLAGRNLTLEEWKQLITTKPYEPTCPGY